MNQLNQKAVLSDYHCGYQQALNDFGIQELKAKLSSFNPERYVEEPDQDSLIAFLIQQLTNSLNSKLINNYFQALSSGYDEVLLLEIQQQEKQQPINFKETPLPCYPDGEILRWIPAKGGVDWGIAIGRFYALAPHLCRMSWKYIILLDSHSPSAAWVRVDTAWEEDLELKEEVAR
ncbi:hypothetical protein [Allocoleopsis sp.]|uniref:hypothetical protein n=1 Tax=Allocoleopsis sp. TaxID=3088169 RepID=UPI002FD63794